MLVEANEQTRLGKLQQVLVGNRIKVAILAIVLTLIPILTGVGVATNVFKPHSQAEDSDSKRNLYFNIILCVKAIPRFVSCIFMNSAY